MDSCVFRYDISWKKGLDAAFTTWPIIAAVGRLQMLLGVADVTVPAFPLTNPKVPVQFGWDVDRTTVRDAYDEETTPFHVGKSKDPNVAEAQGEVALSFVSYANISTTATDLAVEEMWGDLSDAVLAIGDESDTVPSDVQSVTAHLEHSTPRKGNDTQGGL